MKRFLSLLALLSAPPALAQQDGPPAAPDPGRQPAAATMMVEPVAMMIAAFDTDGDARVTRAEFDAGLTASFAAIAGGDAGMGYISYSDWATRYLGDANALPSAFEVDQDGDKRVTLAEMQERFDLFFTRFDADRDGAIARSELITLRGFGMGGRMGGDREGGKRTRRNLAPGNPVQPNPAPMR